MTKTSYEAIIMKSLARLEQQDDADEILVGIRKPLGDGGSLVAERVSMPDVAYLEGLSDGQA